jgi:hypothetical protein
MSEWFWFANSLGWGSYRLFNESIESFERRPVVALPI